MRKAYFGDILEPGLRKIYFDRLKAIPTKYDRIFHVNTSTKQQETDSSVSGFGQFTETSEGGQISYEDPVQGYDVSYVHKSWKKGFKVTEEAYEDDQYNVVNKMPAKLATAAMRTVEKQASRTLVNAFTDGLGGDGVYLCSASHPSAGGFAVQTNTSVMDLAEDALKTARLAMKGTLDDKNELVLVNPDILVVPPALEDVANILVKSVGRPGTTNLNEINPYKSEFEVVVWDYIGTKAGGSDTAWFMIDSQLHELNFFWRKRPVFEQDNAFSTDEALYKGKMRFSHGWSDWRGVFGSTGTN